MLEAQTENLRCRNQPHVAAIDAGEKHQRSRSAKAQQLQFWVCRKDYEVDIRYSMS